MNIKNKRITILGMGKSGVAALKFLKVQGADVFLSEAASTDELKERARQLTEAGYEVEVGSHSEGKIKKSDFVVVSPGIPPQADILQTLEASSILFYSEIEVASWFISEPLVAVTGTNGKSTVTTLIAKILNDAGKPAVSCGNIGNPLIGEVERINQENLTPVVEVSSFQLSRLQNFKPHIGVVLNLEPDHLNWHESLKEYYDSKFLMFRNQTREDFAVLNKNDSEIKKRSAQISGIVKWFSEEGLINANWSACYEVASLLGLDRTQVERTLKTFPGLEHRLERVSSEDGRIYTNDSKSTNLSSLKWALGTVAGPTILILGGRSKGGDFSSLKSQLKVHVNQVIAFGEARGEITSALKGDVNIETVLSLQEAVLKARDSSEVGDQILFSPACASFDQFKNFEDRGRQFKQLIKELCHKTASAY